MLFTDHSVTYNRQTCTFVIDEHSPSPHFCLGSYLISGEILTSIHRWRSKLLIKSLVWAHLKWFRTLMLFVVQRCVASLLFLSVVALLGTSADAGGNFTSECFFYFVGRNEMRAEFRCQCCTSWCFYSVSNKCLNERFGKVFNWKTKGCLKSMQW